MKTKTSTVNKRETPPFCVTHSRTSNKCLISQKAGMQLDHFVRYYIQPMSDSDPEAAVQQRGGWG